MLQVRHVQDDAACVRVDALVPHPPLQRNLPLLLPPSEKRTEVGPFKRLAERYLFHCPPGKEGHRRGPVAPKRQRVRTESRVSAPAQGGVAARHHLQAVQTDQLLAQFPQANLQDYVSGLSNKRCCLADKLRAGPPQARRGVPHVQGPAFSLSASQSHRQGHQRERWTDSRFMHLLW